jgi:hypothetical protein
VIDEHEPLRSIDSECSRPLMMVIILVSCVPSGCGECCWAVVVDELLTESTV